MPHRVRRLAHSLKRDIATEGTWPTIGLTNVVDATHDHANPRAKCTNAESVFRGTAFHLATKEQSTPNAFLLRDFRQRADYTATIYLATTDQPGSNVFLRRDFRPRADYTALKKLICKILKTGIFS